MIVCFVTLRIYSLKLTKEISFIIFVVGKSRCTNVGFTALNTGFLNSPETSSHNLGFASGM